MQLKNSVALITGGAHRVGRAITLGLAQAGAHVVINYNSSEEAAKETEAKAIALGVDALTVQGDVADLAAVEAMHRVVVECFGRLDIVVNSASLFRSTPIPLSGADGYRQWHNVVDILIDGALYVSNTFAPLLLAQENAAIVNIVDVSVFQPWPNLTAHATGKSGLLGLTRQLALELAPTVRVNAVAPGPVLPAPNHSEAQQREIADRTLLKRWGTPEDVAQAVCFLCAADYITGEVLYVDGGERYGRATGW
jgi:3-oxoacyl-[acyl-carrier protein] reductase/pteridine reductase